MNTLEDSKSRKILRENMACLSSNTRRHAGRAGSSQLIQLFTDVSTVDARRAIRVTMCRCFWLIDVVDFVFACVASVPLAVTAIMSNRTPCLVRRYIGDRSVLLYCIVLWMTYGVTDHT